MLHIIKNFIALLFFTIAITACSTSTLTCPEDAQDCGLPPCELAGTCVP